MQNMLVWFSWVTSCLFVHLHFLFTYYFYFLIKKHNNFPLCFPWLCRIVTNENWALRLPFSLLLFKRISEPHTERHNKYFALCFWVLHPWYSFSTSYLVGKNDSETWIGTDVWGDNFKLIFMLVKHMQTVRQIIIVARPVHSWALL